ncbi:acyltransferase family protein [Streptomonospora sp. S1-112]|uniref:Acyltransferase family protein n=1 Tax=Streptomonospora mangrovi TaxID=2883123 RepID=A0A9X3SG65_9ACTN|nr:acyltransferase family protein [Streptomonospora mangrovi]MDA0563819.1 acyltransferase family protein [Streptomonospora mangrovi]
MREHHIDRLRNLGILFLFPYHTARVFNEGASFYVKGEVNAFSSVLVHLSYWFMPLLFLLAGMSSLHALRRRTVRQYVGERFSRLLVPLVFGFLVVVPPQAYYAMRFHSGHQGGYPEFLWSYFTDFSDWSEYGGGISPAHLWFILFLFLIATALALPMRRMAESGSTPAWPRHPVGILLPAVAVAVLSLLPDAGGKNIFVFAAYFLLGFVIAADGEVGDMVRRHRRVYLAAAAVGAAAVLAGVYVFDAPESAALAQVRNLACLPALLALLGYGRRYLNSPTAFTSYFSPAAYPVYILHQTYLVATAYYVVAVVDHGPVAFAVIAAVPFALSLATYELVRRTPLTRVLFGLAGARPARRDAGSPTGA